ncbi:dephospho-CoA kinase [Oleiphilus sp. HI0125]|uniref:dephospho-CoA kinase n=2 Tax=Oleiphilus sp. HI0125 TaxID=1822266 RepID=UPI0007C32C27|nr:dephospho-CoA kinase [Oleiphilus sp. HI0125]KZZ61688.1 dephospho-CoA kinase [Oleiphilus sp. HI0125]
MLIVGLTGGIGSGKSAASDRFETLGVTVVDADVVAREVVEPGSSALGMIAKQFGTDVLHSDGEQKGALNRARLREIIFSDSNAKRWLETLLHPLIRSEIIRQLSQAESAYAILVSPLLFETKQSRLCTRTLLIDATEADQKIRAATRDNASEEDIGKIIAAQMPRKMKQERAHDIILNDGDLDHLNAMVDSQHEEYLKLAESK